MVRSGTRRRPALEWRATAGALRQADPDRAWAGRWRELRVSGAAITYLTPARGALGTQAFVPSGGLPVIRQQLPFDMPRVSGSG